MNDYWTMAPTPSSDFLNALATLREMNQQLCHAYVMPAHLLTPQHEPEIKPDNNPTGESLFVWSLGACIFTFFFVFVVYANRLISKAVTATNVTGAMLSLIGVFAVIYFITTSLKRK